MLRLLDAESLALDLDKAEDQVRDLNEQLDGLQTDRARMLEVLGFSEEEWASYKLSKCPRCVHLPHDTDKCSVVGCVPCTPSVEESPKTTVVSIKSCPPDWKSDPDFVYVGRGGHPFDFGNRHPIGFCMWCRRSHDRHDAVELHAKETRAKFASSAAFRDALEQLRGKILVCFCKNESREVACHADVYVELLEACSVEVMPAPALVIDVLKLSGEPSGEDIPPLPVFDIPPLPVLDDDIPPLPVFDIPPLPIEAKESRPQVASPAMIQEDLALFTPPPVREALVWTDEQLRALDSVDEWFDGDEPLYSLTGPAGSGKTSLVREIVQRYPNALLTAMTGKAAVRLCQLVGQAASTLHSRLYWPPLPGQGFTRMREPASDFVTVDEASMASPSVVRDLRAWGCRVLLVGDGYQLPAVITGQELLEFGEDYSAFGEVKGVALETVMRSVGGVLRAATRVRETGQIQEKSDLDGPGSGYEFLRHLSSMEYSIDAYLANLDSKGNPLVEGEDTLLITWRNKIRMQANRIIRKRLGHDGPLPDDGEPVLLKRNGQGYLNGEILVANSFEDGPQIGSMQTLWMNIGNDQRLLVTVQGGRKDKGGEWMDGQQPWVEDFRKFHIALESLKLPEPTPITWARCLSCHSAQGSQARNTIVFLAKGDERSQHFKKATRLPDGSTAPFSARWAYTAQTRSTAYAKFVMGR